MKNSFFSIQNNRPDYRQQYINTNHDSNRECPSYRSTEASLLTQEKSVLSTILSDFELNYLNTTRTSFYSPSVYSLPTESVQYTRDLMSPTIHALQHSSILMRAYSIQENQRNSKIS